MTQEPEPNNAQETRLTASLVHNIVITQNQLELAQRRAHQNPIQLEQQRVASAEEIRNSNLVRLLHRRTQAPVRDSVIIGLSTYPGEVFHASSETSVSFDFSPSGNRKPLRVGASRLAGTGADALDILNLVGSPDRPIPETVDEYLQRSKGELRRTRGRYDEREFHGDREGMQIQVEIMELLIRRVMYIGKAKLSRIRVGVTGYDDGNRARQPMIRVDIGDGKGSSVLLPRHKALLDAIAGSAVDKTPRPTGHVGLGNVFAKPTPPIPPPQPPEEDLK